MVSAQYLRGARRGGGDLLAGRPKILGEGGNENLYPPLPPPSPTSIQATARMFVMFTMKAYWQYPVGS